MITEFPLRRTSTLVVTLSSKLVFISRMLTAIKPPDLGFSSDSASNLVMEEVMKRLARFVSLIPSLPPQSSPSVNIWLTCEQLLDFGIGSTEDKAVLLCNYFLYLGRTCGLVLGHGIPEGSTCYVIELRNRVAWDFSVSYNVFLWNPVTGLKYSVRDPFIPLTSVGSIVLPDNVS